MPTPLREHTEKITSLLAELDADRAALLKLYHKRLCYEGAEIFPLDIVANGAVKRAVSANSAFKLMIESWNLVIARTLLRTHIDTALRFSAAWLVENPHDFAIKVIAGERINKMKDCKGKQLTDAYLVETHTQDRPWLPKVYSELSGYVHFSGAHVSAAVSAIGKDDRLISFKISDTDESFPESSWIEVIECFRESTEILAHYLQGYALTKQATPAELAD